MKRFVHAGGIIVGYLSVGAVLLVAALSFVGVIDFREAKNLITGCVLALAASAALVTWAED